MPTFDEVNDSVKGMITSLQSDFHPDLMEADVKVGALFVYPTEGLNGEPMGDPVKRYGVPSVTKIKINSESDRLEGKPDATIFIDHSRWSKLSAEEQDAALDGELIRLEVKRKDGCIVVDSHDRPKLRPRKPDWLISGFAIIADRHKQHSQEVIQARAFDAEYRQLLLDFDGDIAASGDVQEQLPGVDPAPKKPRGRGKNAAAVAAANR